MIILFNQYLCFNNNDKQFNKMENKIFKIKLKVSQNGMTNEYVYQYGDADRIKEINHYREAYKNALSMFIHLAQDEAKMLATTLNTREYSLILIECSTESIKQVLTGKAESLNI